MQAFCSRLLVGLEEPDPQLLRYASMVARLNGQALDATTFEPAQPLDSWSPHAPLQVSNNSSLLLDDAEVRFAYLPSRSAALANNTTGTSLRQVLRDQVQTYFTGVPSPVPVGWDVLKGNAVQRLTELATDFESDLLLIGHSPSSRRMGMRLAIEAPCPVWLVPPDWAPVLRHCLIPVDFSPQSAACLRAAIDLARRSRGARCLLLHVHANSTIRDDQGLSAKMLGDLRRASAAFLSAIDCRGVRLDVLIEEGPSVSQVVHRIAEKHAVDLVVMTARRRSRCASFICPSETAQAIRRCPASFLVLKSSPHPVGIFSALRERLAAPDTSQFN
jgi:nucleotide-binding universal stress UspA family protein